MIRVDRSGLVTRGFMGQLITPTTFRALRSNRLRPRKQVALNLKKADDD